MDGSKEKPYPITWPKRPLARYYPYWLAPRDKVAGPTPQADLKKIPGAKLFSPETIEALPGSTVKIGVAENNQTRPDKVVGPKKTGRSEGEKEKFKRAMAAHGFDRTEEPTDADHVVELQVSGTDSFDNLWPLNSAENQAGGRELNNKEIVTEDGTLKRVRDLNGKYFRITGFDR